jgi:site-specific DNA recombinase
MLRLELYRGERIWNKIAYVKDPDTGKRVPRINPESEWQRGQVPELRIVDDELWEAVQARFKGLKPRGKGQVRKRRLLTGILKCGACGAGMAVNGSWAGRLRVQCTRYRESRTCTHSRTYFLDHIEDIVIRILRVLMTDPAWIEDGARILIEERGNIIGARANARRTAAQKVARAEARHDTAFDKALNGDLSNEEWARIRPKLEAELKVARAELAALGKPTKEEDEFDAEREYTRLALAIPKIVEAAAASTTPEAAQLIKLFQGITGPVNMRPVTSEERPQIEILGNAFWLNEKTDLVEVVVAGACNQLYSHGLGRNSSHELEYATRSL